MGSPEADESGESLATCGCGCGREAPRAPGQPHGHHNRKSHRYAAADRGHDSACHIWLLAKSHNGYGVERVPNGPKQYAHRLAYERARGLVPVGMQIDHLCRVRECVNPDHLEAVTQAENARRGLNAKLTAADVGEIRRSTERHRVLEGRYGVSGSHISRVRSGKAWADVLP